MSQEYIPVPVDLAKEIAIGFGKSIVIVCAWDPEHQRLHTTTYGVQPNDKVLAARMGDICAQALGSNLSERKTYEDFRTVDAARNAHVRDRVERNLGLLKDVANRPSTSRGAKSTLKAVISDIEACLHDAKGAKEGA